MGSGPLPTDTIQSVLGFNTLSFLDLAKDLAIFCCGHVYLSRDISLLSVLPNLCTACGVISNLVSGLVNMAAVNESIIVDEIIQETENVCLDDLSIEVSPDNELAKDTIAKSVVGKFYSKKVISNGTLRKALSGLWKLSLGWRFQTVRPKTFIFHLGSPKEVKYVLGNGPWNLCCGYLLVAALPEDEKWESADLTNLDIWVKAMGVPLPYMAEACIHQMAGRMGKLIQANKVRRNGVILNDFLRFQVRLKLAVPLLVGVSLPDYGDKKVWSYFKYEKLPIFCFKCGVIGHVDVDCSAKKWVVTVQDGRSIPLFGSWLRDGSRLANGFALLEVESIHDRSRLENDDPALKGMPLSASNEALIPTKGAEVRDGHTRVEKEGMEGVVSQRADNSFNVAYNDYVDTSKFPTQHVVHVAKLFKEKLGPIKFGATREDEDYSHDHSGKIKKLKKTKLVGPRGVLKHPIFRKVSQAGGTGAGSKRKKVSKDLDIDSNFMDESRGNSCLIIVDKSGVKDVFAEASGVNVPEESDNCDDSGEQAKKARLFLDSLRSVESSLEAIKEGDAERGLNHGRMKAHELMPALVDIENGSFFVYGPPTRAARKDFWEARTMDVLALNHPWLLMGDLNTITGQQDKFGGREVEESDDLIKERLDRALCDPEWMVSYPKAGVRALAIKDSDHAPLVLDLFLDRERFHTPFRYLDAWSRDEGCKAVIQQAWAIDVRGKSAYICSKNVNEDTQAELSQFLGSGSLARRIDFWGTRLSGRIAVRKFWWMGSESKDRFLALCDWNSLCLPLDRGGLNFKKFGDVNLALVAKLGWKLAKEEDSLWCKVFKAKYWGNREQAFWNLDLPRNASFGAKGIMATRDLIRNEACWILADGGKVDLWASPWIPWLDWDKSRAAFNPLCVPNPIKVSSLIGADGEWIASSVQRWFVPSVASSLHLIQRLPSSQDDLLVWKDATNGMFSPSVAY
ncbi:hypothetical protein F8388_018614 [Cannabis sativa]|uniref:CCHC-type domain-containing protein n=1 Tax=Cannabis sativa TaxID=3483 RepID=A0A7J6FFE1_CANSA|nr:hypothetical protein F8388_018614 [Cannabis sativa]